MPLIQVRHFILLWVLLASFPAFAAKKEARYGAEFTFTNNELIEAGKREGEEIVNSEENMLAKKKFKDEVLKTCGKCRLVIKRDRYGQSLYRIVYPDGWWFQIATDPWVLEVQTKPTTTRKFRQIRDRMNKDIFAAAARSGVTPHKRIGGGHIHIGMDAFGGDRTMFRNYIVDQVNQPELAMGVLGRDGINATPFNLLPKENQDAFEDLLKRFDENPKMTEEAFVKELEKKVYNVAQRMDLPPVAEDPWKFQAVNPRRVYKAPNRDARTVEDRYHRPQKSADEFVKLLELKDGRLAYLRKLKAPLPFERAPKNMTRQEMVARFEAWLKKADMNPADYADLLLPEFRKHCSEGFANFAKKAP